MENLEVGLHFDASLVSDSETKRVILKKVFVDEEILGPYLEGFLGANQTGYLWVPPEHMKDDEVSLSDVKNALVRYKEGMDEGTEATWLLFSKETKNFIGEIQLYDFSEGVIRVSIWIIHGEWGNQYAKEIMEEHVVPWVRKTFGTNTPIYWRSHKNNQQSIAVVEKLGGRLVNLIYEEKNPDKIAFVID